jgi:CRP/FNR family cyclic AMP-dependent transcriptional regulator
MSATIKSATIREVGEVVRDHPFFSGLAPPFLDVICGCAKYARFQAGEYLFHEGEPADQFYLLREGGVALELKAPGRTTTFQTLRQGEIVGVSWLVPPYRWSNDARAVEFTRAIAMDAACLRGKCEADHDLGYELMKRFMSVLIPRLQSTRLQILDVYGDHV